jgi:malonyl-CoA/methylmalonyl-CoA synthetase
LGGIFLPLSLAATEKEIAYALEDSGAAGAFVSKSLEPRIKEASGAEKLAIVVTETCLIEKPLQQVDHDPASGAMILYTSGTTAKPKGVLTTHANIQAQIEALVKAWEWSADDRIPLFLPLHHVHGIINVLGSALWSGAMVDVMSRFDASLVCSRLCRGDYTVFMAVPTIYSLLVTHLEKASESDRAASCRAFGQLRLMVSGSAALPTPVFEKWRNLTGQSLLERYGMTEIGMALSNPLHGERRPGTVGLPLPGVEVRLVSESGIVHQPGESGEIQIRGENVFKEYWRKPEATAETFTNDWFRTGDVAVLEDGYYKILGRLSVDIIKSAGYKLSALEIESSLLEHPDIRECAVVGVPDETWGEVVAAALVVSENKPSSEAIEQWCQSKMSRYKIPRLWLISENLPRNAMGKVLKPAVKDLFKQ